LTSRRRRGLVGSALAAALLASLLVWSPWSGSSSRSGTRAENGSGTSTRAADARDGSGPDAGSGSGAAPAGREGGVVRLGLGGPLVVDPPYASPSSPSDLMVLDLLHDGLTEVRGSGASASIGPRLATSWTVDPAQQVWRFALDPTATFSDGRSVVGADVVASIEHVIAGGDASPAALRLEAVRGFRDYLDGRASTVSGLQAPDDRTVEITLDLPLAQLPWILAAPAYGVVDIPSLLTRAADPVVIGGDPEGYEGLPVSGGWQVDHADADGLHLSRRPGSPAHLDGVVLRPFADSGAAYAAFVDEDVDWAPVPSDHRGEAVEVFGDGAFASFQAELLLGLRVTDPVLARPEVRQAIAAALDREAIVQAVYPDVAIALTRVVPPSVATAAEQLPAAPRHDAAAARRLLRAAFPDGRYPTIVLDHEASPAGDALMAIVARSLDDVGLPTEIRPRSLADHQRLVAAGQQHVFTLPWLGGYRSPDAYLDPLFRSSSPDNTLGLADAGIDAALAQARTSTDPAVAAERWRAVEATVLEQAFVIPIAQFRTEVVVADGILGLRHAVDGTVDWSAVQLAA
jgi:ABC-type transport system substrate-binding protein